MVNILQTRVEVEINHKPLEPKNHATQKLKTLALETKQAQAFVLHLSIDLQHFR
jgi:hypothetical protein